MASWENARPSIGVITLPGRSPASSLDQPWPNGSISSSSPCALSLAPPTSSPPTISLVLASAEDAAEGRIGTGSAETVVASLTRPWIDWAPNVRR
jgi:hypothetical protein